MRFIFRLIFRLLLFVCVLVGIVIFFRNSIGIWAAASVLKKTTGFNSSIAFIDIRLNRPVIFAREITLLNSMKAFQEPIAFKVSRLDLNYGALSLLSGGPEIKRMVVELDEAILVRSKRGEINWLQLKSGGRDIDNTAISIDLLELSLNQVSFVDELSPHAPTLKHKPTEKTCIYKNIKSSRALRKIFFDFLIHSSPEKWKDVLNSNEL